ncbi:MAG: type II restriction endonuclease [Treponema sp.]|uniref:type II restriction endonuclease n=1 Tax=Treponema sp. TaxID=166 RepID=UPI003FA22146
MFCSAKIKIAAAHPGSGNTKNIGSIIKIEDLINGNGHFSALGEEIFDDYLMCYLTKYDRKREFQQSKNSFLHRIFPLYIYEKHCTMVKVLLVAGNFWQVVWK